MKNAQAKELVLDVAELTQEIGYLLEHKKKLNKRELIGLSESLHRAGNVLKIATDIEFKNKK